MKNQDTLQKENCEELSDEELARHASSDPHKFGVLISRYEKRLMVYIMRKSNVTQEGAEDILQESFLKAYQNINSFNDRLSFSSWMYRIVHNQTISQWRKTDVRPEGHSVYIDDDFIERFAADEDIPKDIDREILQKNVEEIFSTIDQKYRNVLVLRYMEDKSYEEISDIIKKPMGTVATYLSRGKKQFKEKLEKTDKVDQH